MSLDSTELIYDALADAPGLRPDGAWMIMFAVAGIQLMIMLPALTVLGSMLVRPWTVFEKTTLGTLTSKQFLILLLAAGILVGPLTNTILTLATGWHGIARSPCPSAACLGILTFYPALSAFRAMIPGSRGDIGDGPTYQVAARRSAFGLLATGLVLAPLLTGGLVASNSWDELSSSLARGEHLTAAGTLDQVRVSTVEIQARRYTAFEEHDVFKLGGGELFYAVCTRRTRELLAEGRPYTCLHAGIGDNLTVAYRDKASLHQPAPALKIWHNPGNRS